MHRSKYVAASALMIVSLSLLARPAQQGKPASAARAAAKPARVEFFVMIDPSHGGDDKGAVLKGKLAEKDVTLALAKVLRTELEDRGIPVRLLRETDTAMSLDRRAEITNEQQAGVYVSLHATTGEGVRVYTSLMAPSPLPAEIKLTPWESAQSVSLAASKALAANVVNELKKRKLEASRLPAPLRPLNNITAPAIAVELSLGAESTRGLPKEMQADVASAVAVAIAQARPRTGAQP